MIHDEIRRLHKLAQSLRPTQGLPDSNDPIGHHGVQGQVLAIPISNHRFRQFATDASHCDGVSDSAYAATMEDRSTGCFAGANAITIKVATPSSSRRAIQLRDACTAMTQP